MSLENKHMVASNGTHLFVMRPPLGEAMTRTEALVFAAWLVAVAETLDDDDGPTFADVLTEVQNT